MARVLLTILSVILASVFTHRSGRDNYHGIINAHGEEVLLHTKHVVAEHEGIVGSFEFRSNGTQSSHMSPALDVRFTEPVEESDTRDLVDNASEGPGLTKEEEDDFFARIDALAEAFSKSPAATVGLAKTVEDLCDNAFVGDAQQILDDMFGYYVKQDSQIEGNDWFAKRRGSTSPHICLMYHRMEEGGFWVFCLKDGKILAYAQAYEQDPGWPTAVESAWHFPGVEGAAPELYIRAGLGDFVDVTGYVEPVSMNSSSLPGSEIESTDLPEVSTPAQFHSGCSSNRNHRNDFALKVLSGMIVFFGIQ